MAKRIHTLAHARRLTLLATGALVAAAFGHTGCGSDDDGREFDDVHGTGERFFELGDGRYLSRVQGTASCAFVFEYDPDGRLSYIGTPEHAFEVDDRHFEFTDEGLQGGKTLWRDLLFNKRGYLTSLAITSRSSDPYCDLATTCELEYDERRLVRVSRRTEGQRQMPGRDRSQAYVGVAETTVAWDGYDNIVQISVRVTESVDGAAYSDRTETHSYTSSRRDNHYRQMPMSVATAFGRLDFMATLGLLGLGPDYLPAEHELLVTDNLAAAGSEAPAAAERVVTTLRTVVNADGTLAAENEWTYTYDR